MVLPMRFERMAYRLGGDFLIILHFNRSSRNLFTFRLFTPI